MDYPIRKMPAEACCPSLLEIPQRPKELYVRGSLAPEGFKHLAVVGSRNYSDYAKRTVEYLIGGLRGYPVSVISGLAIGVDTLAHTAALDAGLHTLSVPGSGIEDSALYPMRNRGLARRILESGGGLLSEFEPTFKATQWSFPQRNRIMAGLSHAVLLIEAGEKSGTLITARMAADYNRDVLVVPGNIFSDNSKGVHQFLKLGASPVTTPEDIADALHIVREAENASIAAHTEEELSVFSILTEPRDHDTIIRMLPFAPQESLTLLMRMELAGHIKESNGMFYKV